MSDTSIAASLSAATAVQTRSELSGKFVKQNADQAAAIASLVEQSSAAAKSAPSAGLGKVVDVSA